VKDQIWIGGRVRARIRDTEIYFDIDGASLVPDGAQMRERPTAFLVHGGPGTDHSGWKTRYGRLKEKMQLVYFDHRGQGRSARGNPEKYTLDENVEDMEALRRYLGLGPIVSIGASYGGRVAMAHAARYPDAVSHLILIATTAHAGSIKRAKEIVAERGTPEQIAMSEELSAGRLDTPEKMRRYFEVMGPLYSRRYEAKSGVGLGVTILEPEALNRAHGPGGFLHSLDLRPQLSRITAPTLILAGRHDFRCAPEFSEEMHRLIRGSDLRIFEESAHTIGADEPQKLLDAVAGFLVYNTRENRQ
jgi:proline iminopeptidase